MEKRAFDDLLRGAREMSRHMRGQRADGVRETEIEKAGSERLASGS